MQIYFHFPTNKQASRDTNLTRNLPAGSPGTGSSFLGPSSSPFLGAEDGSCAWERSQLDVEPPSVHDEFVEGLLHSTLRRRSLRELHERALLSRDHRYRADLAKLVEVVPENRASYIKFDPISLLSSVLFFKSGWTNSQITSVYIQHTSKTLLLV